MQQCPRAPTNRTDAKRELPASFNLLAFDPSFPEHAEDHPAGLVLV
jgi:hypothetical protein